MKIKPNQKRASVSFQWKRNGKDIWGFTTGSSRIYNLSIFSETLFRTVERARSLGVKIEDCDELEIKRTK